MVIILHENKDILGHLFSFFGSKYLVVASKVCKLWRNITLEFFPWAVIYCYSADTPIERIEFNETFIRKLFEHCFNAPSLWRFTEYNTKVEFEINVVRLEELLNESEVSVVGLDELVLLLTTINTKAIHLSLFSCAHFIPSKLGALTHERVQKRELPPKGLKDGVMLHQHQLDALTWLKHREASCSSPIIFSNVTSLRSSNFQSNFSTTDWVHPRSEELRANQICSGGILADEDGLGKSLTVIALILSNPAPPLPPRLLSSYPSNLKGLYPTRATIIFCPLLHVEYWKHQIATFTNSLRVICLSVFDDSKNITYRNIVHADIVIVSFTFVMDQNYFFIGNFAETTHMPSDDLISEWISKSLLVLKNESRQGMDHTSPVLEYFAWHRLIVADGQDKLSSLFFHTFKWLESKHRWMVSATPFPSYATVWGLAEFFSLNFNESNVVLDFIASKLTWRNTSKTVTPKFERPYAVASEVKLLDHTEIECTTYTSSKDVSLDQRLQNCCFITTSSLSSLRFNKLSAYKAEICAIHAEMKSMSEKISESRRVMESEKSSQLLNPPLHSSSPPPLVYRQSCRRFETRNIFSYLAKMNEMKRKLVVLVDAFSLVYATQDFFGPWFDLYRLFETLNDETIASVLQQSLGLEEYINRRRREREERKEVMESIKPEVDLATLQKSKPTQNITKLEKGSDDAKKHVEDKGHEEFSFEEIQTGVDFIISLKLEKPKKSVLRDDTHNRDISKRLKFLKLLEMENVEEQILPFLINKCGTKTGNLLFTLRKLWTRDPFAKVIIFSSYDEYLNVIEKTLEKCGIACGVLRGYKTSKDTMAWGRERVLIMNFKTTFWQPKTVNVSHIFLMNPVNVVPANSALAIEELAINICRPQKGRKHISIVKFIINHSLEAESFQVQTRKRSMSATPPVMNRHSAPSPISPLKL